MIAKWPSPIGVNQTGRLWHSNFLNLKLIRDIVVLSSCKGGSHVPSCKLMDFGNIYSSQYTMNSWLLLSVILASLPI